MPTSHFGKREDFNVDRHQWLTQELHIGIGARGPAIGSKGPPPLRGGVDPLDLFQGFRFAAPLATHLDPSGAATCINADGRFWQQALEQLRNYEFDDRSGLRMDWDKSWPIRWSLGGRGIMAPGSIRLNLGHSSLVVGGTGNPGPRFDEAEPGPPRW